MHSFVVDESATQTHSNVSAKMYSKLHTCSGVRLPFIRYLEGGRTECQTLRPGGGKDPQPDPCPNDPDDTDQSTWNPLLHATRGSHSKTKVHLKD